MRQFVKIFNESLFVDICCDSKPLLHVGAYGAILM